MSNSKIIIPKEFYEFDDLNKRKILKIFDNLKSIGCTYMSYALEGANNKRYHFYTNAEWQNSYIKTGLVNQCPLIRYARQRRPLIIRWNDIQPSNKIEKNVIGIRGEHNLGNGIGMTHWFFNMNEHIAFASELTNKDFPIDLIIDIETVKRIIFAIRKIALESMIMKNWISKLEAEVILEYSKFNL